MKWNRIFIIIPLSLTLVLVTVTVLIACMGSPTPPSCPQSIYFAKTTTGSVLIPAGSPAFTAPIGLSPFISWDDPTVACADPASASATFILSCTPPGGSAFSLGPVTFPLTTPTTPGAQASSTVAFPIPAGTPPSVCTVMGTYDVVFGAGIGTGTLSATGDTQVCLVEPSPSDSTLPRLDLQLITPPGGEPGVFPLHQGDQTWIYFKAFNNDLTHSATFNFFSEGRQIAGLPDGFDDEDAAYDAGVFRISNTDGDVFPSDFFFENDALPIDRLPGDPLSPDPGRLDGEFTLEPGEVEVFGIAINSFGACADGSCNERNICADVELTNGGDPEFAKLCTQFAYLVDNELGPRYPGLTVRDELKTHPQVDAQWSGVQFFDATGDLIDEMHGMNLTPDNRIEDDLDIQTTGDDLRPGLPPEFQFPDMWFDQVTLPTTAASAEFDLFIFDERDGFAPQRNRWKVSGLDGQDAPCPLPGVSYFPGFPADLEINLESDGACGDDSVVELFLLTGADRTLLPPATLGEMRDDAFLKIDDESCRTLTFPHGNLIEAPLFQADPPFMAQNFDGADPLTELIRLLDELGNPIDSGTATLTGPDGALLLTPDVVDGEVMIQFDPTVFTGLGATREWNLIIENDAFVNSPIMVPVVGRFLPPLLPIAFEFDLPPLAQAGQPLEGGIFIPPLEPEPVDPYFNMEFFIGIETEDPIEIMIPDSLDYIPIGPNTPGDEVDRLKSKFGEDPINRCSEGVWKCGKIEFGDGFTFESEIFADGFESGDVSSWSTGAAADNSQRQTKEQKVGVLDEEKKLPVFTEEELRKAIELFNDDVVFDEKTIGLVSEQFGIEVPLPPIRGTYFFDEFESFRKQGANAPVTIDGSQCPAPCSGFVFESRSGINGIRIEGFPDYGAVLVSDSIRITRSEFVSNGKGGIQIASSGHVIGDSLETSNRFENNGGAGIEMASGDGNTILFNTFTGNTGGGIDLGGDGVTNNDTGDPDVGANQLQNFPVLTRVLASGAGNTMIEGTLNSLSDRTYTLQFFANETCHASGHGEGASLLGATQTSTDANGNAAFSLSVDSTTAIGQFVTSTATEDDHGRTSEFSACFEIVSGVSIADEVLLPTAYAVYQNYPNPFNPSTTIHYDVPQANRIQLVVFDLLGRTVATLVNERKEAGRHEITFDADDLPSGTYFYQLRTQGFTETKKLVLLR